MQGSAQDDTVQLSNLDAVFQGNIHIDLKDGADRLNFVGADHRIDLASEAAISISGLEWIDMRGHGANHLTFSEYEISELSDSEIPLTVMLEADDTLEITDGDFRNVGSVVQDDQFFVITQSVGGTPLKLGGLGWSNPLDRLDVDNSNTLESFDILLVVNELNRRTREDPRNSQLADPAELQLPFPLRFYDTSADGLLTPYDVLLAVNGLAKQIRLERASAELHAPQNEPPESAIPQTLTRDQTTVDPPTSQPDLPPATSPTTLTPTPSTETAPNISNTDVAINIANKNSGLDQPDRQLEDSVLTLLANDTAQRRFL